MQGTKWMADNIDFFKLYAALGLQPGFTLEEFKRAYRRQVAMLHPDQQASLPQDRSGSGREAALAELQQINRLYDAAMDFHRVHGRMPGMRAPRAGTAPSSRPAVATPGHASAPSPAVAEKPLRLRYVLLMAAMIAVVYGVEHDGASMSGATAPPAEPEEHDAGQPAASRHRLLSLGMDVDEVLEIQGNPLSMHEARLDYGPSWVALRCGRVSDWYSSPLRPLHVNAPAPTDQAREMAATLLPPDC